MGDYRLVSVLIIHLFVHPSISPSHVICQTPLIEFWWNLGEESIPPLIPAFSISYTNWRGATVSVQLGKKRTKNTVICLIVAQRQCAFVRLCVSSGWTCFCNSGVRVTETSTSLLQKIKFNIVFQYFHQMCCASWNFISVSHPEGISMQMACGLGSYKQIKQL